MFKLISVTNRRLCGGSFKEQVERIAKAGISAVILREKDLEEAQYQELAKQIIPICEACSVPCILHTFPKTAKELGQDTIHLPLAKLRENEELKKLFKTIGVSVHSVEEAVEAQQLGAAYLTAGHIFATDCKKGLPPRGTGFLRRVVEAVSIPVYGIGGITEENAVKIKEAGAAGACIMSSLMAEPFPEKLVYKIQKNITECGKNGC